MSAKTLCVVFSEISKQYELLFFLVYFICIKTVS